METQHKKSVLRGLLIGGLAMLTLGRSAVAQTPAAEAPKLRIGDAAPDFKLQYFDGHDLKDVHLSDYRGKKNVVLAFYVFAFTGG
jgi:hypothetical protein